jgi:hypothetical protein
MSSKKFIKHICKGCGVEFDLDASKFRRESAYGKRDFFHTAKCGTIYRRKTYMNYDW